jgi:hypothetical protein
MSSSPPGFTPNDLDHQASTNRRFVIQLRIDADPASGVCRGRVQHLRSGEAAHFDSLEELALFFTAMTVKERSDTLSGTSRGGPAP